MVRRGIEAANEGLRKENDERLMQEGVLRQVPLVGSLLNWWAPMPKEVSARGRTFDLKTGTALEISRKVLGDGESYGICFQVAFCLLPSSCPSV